MPVHSSVAEPVTAEDVSKVISDENPPNVSGGDELGYTLLDLSAGIESCK
jgi:hypothetical protein